ncbi:unnamed protein product, partial [Amoebophrya sp. A25]
STTSTTSEKTSSRSPRGRRLPPPALPFSDDIILARREARNAWLSISSDKAVPKGKKNATAIHAKVLGNGGQAVVLRCVKTKLVQVRRKARASRSASPAGPIRHPEIVFAGAFVPTYNYAATLGMSSTKKPEMRNTSRFQGDWDKVGFRYEDYLEDVGPDDEEILDDVDDEKEGNKHAHAHHHQGRRARDATTKEKDVELKVKVVASVTVKVFDKCWDNSASSRGGSDPSYGCSFEIKEPVVQQEAYHRARYLAELKKQQNAAAEEARQTADEEECQSRSPLPPAGALLAGGGLQGDASTSSSAGEAS